MDEHASTDELTTALLDDSHEAARPRIRWAALVWALVFATVAGLTLWTTTSPVRRREFELWLADQSAGSFVLYAVLAVGAVLLLLGLASLAKRAGHRARQSSAA
jgi:hypothetical protein